MINRWNRDINIPPGIDYDDPAAPWNEEDDDRFRVEDMQDQLIYLLRKSGYEFEVVPNGDLYLPEYNMIVKVEEYVG